MTKKIKLLTLGAIFSLTALSAFSRDIDSSKLATPFRNDSYKIDNFTDTEANPPVKYLTFNKRQGQFELLIDVSFTEAEDIEKIFIKSSHIHTRPNMSAIKNNFQNVKNYIENSIVNEELKGVFKKAIVSFPKDYQSENFEASTLTGGNSIEVTVQKKQPEIDWSAFTKDNN